MLRQHKIIMALGAVLVILAAAAIVIALNAPQSSGVQVGACVQADGGDCLLFPTVSGTNLLGTAFRLPQDFAGEFNLVLVSFEEAQTARAIEWLPLAQDLAAQHEGFRYYNLPTLNAVNPLLRGVITGGMTLLIPDEEGRAITVMLFLDDLDAFLAALEIEDKATMQAFLLNARGEVVWRAAGDFSETVGESLREALEQRE
jgi:hypothetical protein